MRNEVADGAAALEDEMEEDREEATVEVGRVEPELDWEDAPTDAVRLVETEDNVDEAIDAV